GDEAPVAAPPQGLRAHHCEALAGGRALLEGGERLAERRRVHVLGVGAEGVDAPDGMPRLLLRQRAPPSSEDVAAPLVRDAGLRQRALERLPREVRVTTRAGEAAHVDEDAHVRLAQHLEQLLEGARAMADGED